MLYYKRKTSYFFSDNEKESKSSIKTIPESKPQNTEELKQFFNDLYKDASDTDLVRSEDYVKSVIPKEYSSLPFKEQQDKVVSGEYLKSLKLNNKGYEKDDLLSFYPNIATTLNRTINVIDNKNSSTERNDKTMRQLNKFVEDYKKFDPKGYDELFIKNGLDYNRFHKWWSQQTDETKRSLASSNKYNTNFIV